MTNLPAAPTLPAFGTIVDDFEFIDEWDEKYRYIIDLGRHLPDLPEDLRTEQTRVKGCASQVWLVLDKIEDTLVLAGDSDAAIVKGLVAIVISLYGGVPLSQAAALNAQEKLSALDLSDHITPQRSNGLVSMLKRIEDWLWSET